MNDRVDAVTMICVDHAIPGCMLCMVDDFHHWLDEQRFKRERIRQERRALTVAEKYDLGGEA